MTAELLTECEVRVARDILGIKVMRFGGSFVCERVLMELFERDRWTMLSHLLIWHGRRTCHARKPKCGECALNTICPSAFRV